MRNHRGFTVIELITVVVILGIMAAVALPRLGNVSYRAQEFRDRTVSALRYAQKTAVSHKRVVCVTFTNVTITLAIDTDDNLACDTPLILPGGSVAVVQSGDAARAFFAPVPADFNFRPDGSSPGAAISFGEPAQAAITVAGATGYVE